MARYSAQRELIIALLRGTKTHPTAADIYNSARKIMPQISLGTVYRDLGELSSAGEIASFYAGGSRRFDADRSPHPHLFCRECGGIIDLPLTEGFSALLEEDPNRELDFLLFNGVCRECINKQKERVK